MIIPDFILQILTKIESANHRAYVVGGCVRDSLMGKTPSDWDIATSAEPLEIQNIFCDRTVIPTGIKHGTVTVLANNSPVEITTFRIDGKYSDSRHPESVIFSKTLDEDLRRRDFTINAMAFNPRTGIVDLFDGQKDLKSKIIRTVGVPSERFSEDALRIMRAIRFSAVLGFEIEKETSAAMFDLRHLLSNIASERITSELNKIFLSQNASRVLAEFFPIFSPRVFRAETSADINIDVFEPLNLCSPSLPLRLAIFLICSARMLNLSAPETAEVFFSSLRFDSKTARGCRAILENIGTEISFERIPLRKQVSLMGFELVQNLVEAQSALNLTVPENLRKAKAMLDAIKKENDCCHIKSLDLSGSDLMSAFGFSGKTVGKALDFLLDAVINEKCENKKTELVEYLKNNKMG